ncbi:MAG: haloalkane dehalogenase [Blastocatellia bacterium]|nr:haloalkane dehalogenase [Blastocatellia bacterium]
MRKRIIYLMPLFFAAFFCIANTSISHAQPNAAHSPPSPANRATDGVNEEISAGFPFKSRFVEVEGAMMHYIDEGAGDPILLLHGTPTSVYVWRNIIPHLALLGRVIAVDLIGFGKSGKPDIEYRFADHYKYVEGFIEKMQLKNITLVLHDWGGAIGFHYAVRHESNVKGIAFFEALLAPLPKLEMWPENYRKLWRAFRTRDEGWDMIVNRNYFIEKRLPSEVMRKLTQEEMNHYREPFKDPSSRKPLWRWPNELPIGGEPADVAKIQDEYIEKLKRSDLPKLLIYAKPGSLMPEQVVEWAKQNFTNLKTVYVGEGLHNIQEDLPLPISAALAEWIHLDLDSQNADKTGDSALPPPGKLYDIGGYKLHINCTGKGGPTIVLESGAPGWSIHWSEVQKEVAKFARVCTYDRAGYGWSEPGPHPRTAKQAAEELHKLLAKSGEKGPYILAGHSFGGYVVRLFADQYPKDVAGIVLVDAAHEQQWERLPGARQAIEASFPGRQETIAKARAGQLKKEDYSDPPSPDTLAAYRYAWLRPETHETALAEQQSAFDSAKQVAATKPLGDRPLLILSAGNSFAWFIEPTEANLPVIKMLNELWLEMQKEMAKLSSRSKHIISEKSTHAIVFQQPDVVADAIRQMIDDVKRVR